MRTSDKLKRIPERLRDHDLTNEKHDAIVRWIDHGVQRLGWAILGDHIEQAVARETTLRPMEITFALAQKTWEYAITKGGPLRGTEKSVIGFVDLCAAFTCSFGALGYQDRRFTRSLFVPTVCFEAKTYITSCGELIRQIRLYQTYQPSSTVFVVVSPDTRHAAQLEDQGIGFITFPDAEAEEVA
jgi:hypothetical protein